MAQQAHALLANFRMTRARCGLRRRRRAAGARRAGRVIVERRRPDGPVPHHAGGGVPREPGRSGKGSQKVSKWLELEQRAIDDLFG